MGLAALGKSLKALGRLGKRGLRVLPDMIVGEGACSSESIAKVMKNTKGSIFTKMEAGFKSVETYVSQQKKGFWTRTWQSIKSIKRSAILGYRKAGKANKNKIWGGTKGVFKYLGNKVPLFMTGVMLYQEVTNIYDTVKEDGLIAGLWEFAKTPFRFAGAVAGAAIGTLCIPIPFVGPILGWTAGTNAVSGVLGKSHNDKKIENEMKEEEVLAKYGFKKNDDGTLAYAATGEQAGSQSTSQNGQKPSDEKSSNNPLYDYLNQEYTSSSPSNPLADYFNQQSSSSNPYMAFNNPYLSGMGGMNMNLNNMLGGMGAYQNDVMAQTLNFNV